MRPLLILLALFCTFTAATADSIPEFSRMPHIKGVLRTRWEADFGSGEQRFQVRNARVAIYGDILPGISYFIQPDLCDRGKMKILDAYGQIQIIDGLNIRAGQFKMPIGVETFRAPATYIFNNRSAIGRYICNYRAVGARVSYRLRQLPLLLEAGAFNPSLITDHDTWNKTIAFGSKLQYFLRQWTFTTGFQSVKPSTVRINYADAAVGFLSGRWEAAAEYMYKHYTHHVLNATHSWCLWGTYRMPVKAGIFNYLSFQGRWDGMTDNSDGITSTDDNLIHITDPARNRFTLGSTTSYTKGRYGADIRVNYETFIASPHISPLFSVELVLRF